LINKLKTRLENEKMGNIQLVHWKANNLKTIDEMDRQLAIVSSAEDVNIDLLLKRLLAAHTELDGLLDYSAKFNEVADENIRQPIAEVATMWNEILDATKRESFSRNARTTTAFERQKERKRIAFEEKLRNENMELQQQNEELRSQIAALESEKLKKSVQVKAVMEETLMNRGITMRARTRLAGKILRPITGPARPMTRNG
jgi:hypothetical protein